MDKDLVDAVYPILLFAHVLGIVVNLLLGMNFRFITILNVILNAKGYYCYFPTSSDNNKKRVRCFFREIAKTLVPKLD